LLTANIMATAKKTKAKKIVKKVVDPHPHFELHGEAVLLSILSLAIAFGIFAIPMSPLYLKSYVGSFSLDSLRASLVIEPEEVEESLTKEECSSLCNCASNQRKGEGLDIIEIESDPVTMERIMRSRYLRTGMPIVK